MVERFDVHHGEHGDYFYCESRNSSGLSIAGHRTQTSLCELSFIVYQDELKAAAARNVKRNIFRSLKHHPVSMDLMISMSESILDVLG